MFQDDPDPPMLWAVLPLALLYAPAVATNAASWALAAVYLWWRTFLAVACLYFLCFGAFSPFVKEIPRSDEKKCFLSVSLALICCTRLKQRDINMEAHGGGRNKVVVRPSMYLVAR